MNRLRKESIINNKRLEDLLEESIMKKASTLSGKDRIQVASQLMALGYTQRKVSNITRVSRDTIRKVQLQTKN